MQTFADCKVSPPPQLLLDLGVVEQQLGSTSKAISVTKKCLAEIEWLLSQSNPTVSEKFELLRLMTIAQYNLMNFRLKLGLAHEAQSDGESALMSLKRAEQISRTREDQDPTSMLKGQTTPTSLQSRGWGNTTGKTQQENRALILLEYGDLSKSPQTSNVQETSPETHDENLPNRSEVKVSLAGLEQKILDKLQQVHARIQKLLEDEDAITTLDLKIFDRRRAVQAEITQEANASKTGSVDSKNQYKNISTEIPKPRSSLSQVNPPGRIIMHSPVQKSSKLHSLLGSRGRINQTETGVRMKNCDLSSFLTEPLYYLDEFAPENDKKSLRKHSIGRVIKNSHVAIYSGLVEKKLHTSLARITDHPSGSAVNVRSSSSQKRQTLQTRHPLTQSGGGQAPYLFGPRVAAAPAKPETQSSPTKGVFIIKSKANSSKPQL